MKSVSVSYWEVMTGLGWASSNCMNWSFGTLQLEGTSCCRLGPVWGKVCDTENRFWSGSSRLRQKTGLSWTFKHYCLWHTTASTLSATQPTDRVMPNHHHPTAAPTNTTIAAISPAIAMSSKLVISLNPATLYTSLTGRYCPFTTQHVPAANAHKTLLTVPHINPKPLGVLMSTKSANLP